MKLLIVLVIIVSAVQLSQVSAEESCDSMSSENDTSLWNCVTGMGLNALSTYPYLKYLLIFFIDLCGDSSSHAVIFILKIFE